MIGKEETTVTEKPNSVEVSINASGKWAGKVKCYSATIEEAMQQALVKAVELEQKIRYKNGINMKKELI